MEGLRPTADSAGLGLTTLMLILVHRTLDRGYTHHIDFGSKVPVSSSRINVNFRDRTKLHLLENMELQIVFA